MKKILFLLALVCFATNLFSQKVFEGKILYKVINTEGKEAGIIEVLFGKEKIKTTIIKNNYPKKATGDLLLDFSKGLVYHIYYGSKEYKIDSLLLKSNSNKSQKFIPTGAVRNIAGYNCKAYINTTPEEKRYMEDDSVSILWYSDSLFFYVDAKFAITEEMMFLINGKTINLGITTSAKNADSLFKVLPISITAMPLPDSLFKMPADYALEAGSFYKTKPANADTEYKIKMTELKKDSPTPPPPPPPPLPKSTKKSIKSAVSKPKQ